MNLIVDIGNTRTKLGVFKEKALVKLVVYNKDELIPLENIISDFPDIEKCILSSVRNTQSELIKSIQRANFKTLVLTEETPLPFKNNYKSPKSLGKDRLAAVAGAYFLYPNKDLLIIDAGTALTIDLFTVKEGYLGGNISPGMEMRFKALNRYTEGLPLINSSNYFDLIGKTSEEAIRNGVQNGLIFELNAYLTKFSKIYPQIAVILTGGDAHFFDNKLKKTIFVDQNLTLIGLNFILDYNAKTF